MDGEHEIQKAYESILGHDFQKAIEWFEKAIAVEPDNAAYHYKLSITYARSNKLHKAIDHATKAAHLEESSQAYKYHLQILHARALVEEAQYHVNEKEEHPEKAIFLLKEAIALDPLAIEAYLILGEVFAKRHDYHRARQTVLEALRLEPDHELAKQQLDLYERQMK
ncbi:tetratricopeptide repeat protein [Paenibacillus hexagrammi]|uniref:Tetratricopeptide repeat protein n=1 Tax=Paenibacillus hexagrammi TaxID=2908839 RepID=A0ABY3SRS1_9BACL|nr:tetratricopeptide repeat protein [Paenibacillus sp. YPD9-1]UJF36163.1 tetratricopeptide repeat protein [Paenibacillus sp. YPD9-1]